MPQTPREIFDRILTIYVTHSGSQRDRECCLWIREYLNGMKIDEIAKRRGTTMDDALFKHDYGRLYQVCKAVYPEFKLNNLM